MKSKGLLLFAATGIAVSIAMAAIAQTPLGGFRPASVPEKYFTAEEAIARALNNSHQRLLNRHGDRIYKNKDILDNYGIAQERVSQSVARLQGQKIEPSLIPVTLSEIDQTLRLLDDALAEIDALKADDPSAYQQAVNQRTSQNLIYQLIPLYWQANGYRNTSGHITQALSETQRLLDTFFANTSRLSPENEQHRLNLEQIRTDLESLQQYNKAILEKFSALIGVPADMLERTLFTPVKSLRIPELELDHAKFDENILKTWTVNEQINLEAVNRYLSGITPGLNFDWQEKDFKTTRNWLSTGKNNAYDLYNQLDHLQRKKILKENDKSPAAADLLIPAAALTRAHLAMLKYIHSREIFTLSHCRKLLAESFSAKKKQLFDNSLASKISILDSTRNHIKNTQQYISDYGLLVKDFYLLKNSIFNSKPDAGLESGEFEAVKRVLKKSFAEGKKSLDSSIYFCYQNEKQMADLAVQNAALQKQKETETRRANELAAKLDDLTNREKIKKRAEQQTRKDWVRQTSPRAWTLQLKSAKDLETLQGFIRRYKLGKQARITETSYRGKVHYNLLYGTYGNKELAYIAQFGLPQALQDNEKIWIRRYSDIQKQMK